MSQVPKPVPGSAGWIDLTVPDAAAARRFCEAVAGWTTGPVAMDGSSDWCMRPAGAAQPVTGIGHQRVHNAGMPTAWIIYITVASLDDALARVRELGGKVVTTPSGAGPQGRYAVIAEPAGAVCALYESA